MTRNAIQISVDTVSFGARSCAVTQNQKDIPRYEKLLGRTVEVINMGDMGHTALLFNPEKYLKLFEQALV
jgi:hypothetical protein